MENRANVYAGLINQFKFDIQTVFSSRSDQRDEEDQILVKNEFYNSLNLVKS